MDLDVGGGRLDYSVNWDRAKTYAIKLWPIRGEHYQLFVRRFRTELWAYCLTTPFFLAVPLYVFRAMSQSDFGMGVVHFLFACLFLIPWFFVPTVVILAYKKTWPILAGWGLYNLAFIICWLIFFEQVLG